MNALLRHLGRFRRDEDGNAVIEFLLTTLLFVLAMALPLTAYGFYSTMARDTKASYAIADSLSRETRNITPEYLDTMYSLYKQLTGHKDATGLRVSVVDYDPAAQAYRVRWHRTRIGSAMSALSDVPPSATILSENLPPLADYEAIIMVETFVTHDPIYANIGISTHTFERKVISRPRNGPQLCVTDSSDPDSTARTC